MVKSSVMHRQYRPATASTTLSQMARGAFFFRKMLRMGTMTIYSAVINPAFPLVVVSNPFCWRLVATVRATPQQVPPMARSFQDLVALSTIPFCIFLRTRQRIRRNKNAMTERAALKVKGST